VEPAKNRQDAMTSVLIPSKRNRFSTGSWCGDKLVLLVLAGCAISLSACSEKQPELNARYTSPYPADKVWAVAPFTNESGTTAIDTLHVADIFANELQKVRGISIVPVSRVLEAMHVLDLAYIDSVGDAQSLARLLDADGLVAGTITSYDPYHPPRLGMTVQLYTQGTQERALDHEAGDGYDIGSSKGMRLLGTSPNDQAIPGLRAFTQPVASASSVYDASDNAVQLEVESFARGRTDSETALGWERFLYSMDQYTQFVCDRLIRDLLRQERLRSGGFDRWLAAPPASEAQPPTLSGW
jgi:hypothetical protein